MPTPAHSISAEPSDRPRGWDPSRGQGAAHHRFRNELGAHAGFSGRELHGLLAARFIDIRSLTGDYLRFKYGDRLPERFLHADTSRGLRDVAAPSVYAVARKPA